MGLYKCGSTQRVYVVRDPGGYDWNPRMVGVYSDEERAQRAATYDTDLIIESIVLDCDCSDEEHRDRNVERNPGVFLDGGWRERTK